MYGDPMEKGARVSPDFIVREVMRALLQGRRVTACQAAPGAAPDGTVVLDLSEGERIEFEELNGHDG